MYFGPQGPSNTPRPSNDWGAECGSAGAVGCGGMGMERDGTSPTFLFPPSGTGTCHLSGAGSWVPGAAPEGGRPGRRRPTHPPPQEAERCTWRPVLQLSPETGPAGRERRQWRRRGRAQDSSGRRSGQKVARRPRQATTVARPTRLASSRPPAAAAPGQERAARPTCCALARPPPPRRPEPPPRTPETGLPAPRAAERRQVSGPAPPGLPSLRRAPAAGWAPPGSRASARCPGAACHPQGAGQRRGVPRAGSTSANVIGVGKTKALPGSPCPPPQLQQKVGARVGLSGPQARLSPAPLSPWR